MYQVKMKTHEVDITLEYEHLLGSKPTVRITGTGDFSHHLIEGLFEIVDKLARTENCCHRKEEYQKRRGDE